MKKLAICCASLLAACGPGADVNSFPSAYADAYCHFLYQCCTPADRANVDPANPFNVAGLEAQYDFDDESDCDAKLGEEYQITFQPQQASVKDKRTSYDQNDAQACLNAISDASSSCDPAAFVAATATSGAACNTATYFTGLVPAGGTCTLNSDCAGLNSVCTPLVADGGTPIVTSAGSCTPAPALGAPCTDVCAAGACFPGAGGSVCTAYIAVGAACASGPCDPSVNYCSSAGSCTALVATGAACVPANQGADCVSGNCDTSSSTCQPLVTATLQVCVGNPDGI
jgi:hypothetical protein